MNRFARTLAGLLATAALVGGAAHAATAMAPGAAGAESGIVLADGTDAFDWE